MPNSRGSLERSKGITYFCSRRADSTEILHSVSANYQIFCLGLAASRSFDAQEELISICTLLAHETKPRNCIFMLNSKTDSIRSRQGST